MRPFITGQTVIPPFYDCPSLKMHSKYTGRYEMKRYIVRYKNVLCMLSPSGFAVNTATTFRPG